MKKIYLTLCILCTITGLANAQFNYQNLLEKKKFSKIQKKLEVQYEKHPNDVAVLYDLSILYSQKGYKAFDSNTAYEFIKSAEEHYNQSENKEKLNKKLLNETTIEQQIQQVSQIAFGQKKEENSVAGYNAFLDTYVDNESLRNKATKLRNGVAFAQAKAIHSIEAYQRFIDTYPRSTECSEARKQRNALAYSDAQRAHTIDAYQQFINTYPHALEIEKATDARDQLAFAKEAHRNTTQAYQRFLTQYPNSKLHDKAIYKRDQCRYFENIVPNSVVKHIEFLDTYPKSAFKESISDSLFFVTRRQQNLHGFQYLIEHYDYSKLAEPIWLNYYNLFTNDGYPATYDRFYTLYKDAFPFMHQLIDDYTTSQLIDSLQYDKGYQPQLETLYKKYIAKANNKYFAYQLLQMILKPQLDKKNWTEALHLAEDYHSSFGNNNTYYNELLSLLQFSDRNIRPKNAGKNINTIKGGEYSPVISADDQLLYFCGKGRKDNLAGEDIYVSEKKFGVWQKATLVESLCTYGNDAPEHISVDGNKILAFKNGDLYYSDQTYYGWGPLEKFPEPVNSDKWDADIKISSDGKAILFSSQREDINKGTGVDLIREKNIDIYVCLKTDNGWSEPINLGRKINTRFTDRTPYLHSDMKTLYFASSGHGGLGGLDVFKATRLHEDSWTEWSEPINMGKEINTTGTDWDYKVSTDGSLAYFSGTNKGESDVYSVELPMYLRPGFVATISGKLLDRNKKPIESIIKWEDLATGKVVGESKSNPKDGSFFIVLPLGKVYGYFIDKDEYYPISNNIDLRTETEPVKVENDIEMVTFKQMIKEGTAVPINNLFFPVNKDKLLPESISELKRVAQIISANNLSVEISGHTDNDGTEKVNQELSEKRAQAVCNYLISLDVAQELIKTVGYGASCPVADNETEEGKAKNRRVEIKFL